MINGKTILGIIPARGGSKRLLKKNIKMIANKPLLQWTLEAGKQSKFIDRLIVTSDDEDILKISTEQGADIVRRPVELSEDHTSTYDAIKHTIEKIEKNYDLICLLQPTSPLRHSDHIDEALELLIEKKSDAIISVSEVNESPHWSNTLNEEHDMSKFLKSEIKNKRSQDLKTFYHINGAIYICKTDKLLTQKTFFIKSNIYAYIMDRGSSIDIDDEFDFLLADLLLKNKNNTQYD
jgi:CMP-N,N'-diacetyllegionaminic acid synthase